VIVIPFISTTLSGRSLSIIGRFTPEETKQIVAGLRKSMAAPASSTTAPLEISGRVMDSGGQPVAGAQVALCTKDKGVSIFPPQLRSTSVPGKTSEIVKTDADGRFLFLKVPAEFAIIAAHQTGFARVDGADVTGPLTIRLERWGQVEGTLYVGPQPVVDEIVYLYLDVQRGYETAVRYTDEAPTKAGGRFVFRQVIPAWLMIGAVGRVGDGSGVQRSLMQQPIYVKPGETLEIRVGGTGRPVVGKLVAGSQTQSIAFGVPLPPDSDRPGDLTKDFCVLETVGPEPPKPAGYDQMTVAEQRQWYRQWFNTPEGRAYDESRYHALNRRSYHLSVDEKGVFRIEDVIPGRYEFSVVQREPVSPRPPARPSSPYHATIEVPPMAQTYTSEPLDLGAVMLKKYQPPQ
jgi:hypothetical protein